MKKLAQIFDSIGEWFKWKSRICWRKHQEKECSKGNHCPTCLKCTITKTCCICGEELKDAT